MEEAIEHPVQALGPVLRQAAMELAEQAAVEVRALLPDRVVELVLVDGDPSLRITEQPTAPDAAVTAEDLDARITLRVTRTLKNLIEEAADTAGTSVNGRVLDALAKRARKAPGSQGFRSTHSFDL